jgi:hypothetical protein
MRWPSNAVWEWRRFATLLAFLVAALTSGAAQGAAYTFDATNGFNETFFLIGDISAPEGVSLHLVLNVLGPFPSDCTFSSPQNCGEIDAFGGISLYDNNNALVGSGSVRASATNCSFCFIPGALLNSGVVVTDSLRTINISGGAVVLSPVPPFDVQLVLNLPDNLTPTPLPGALPLFAGGLGVMGWLGWRKKRSVSCRVRSASRR